MSSEKFFTTKKALITLIAASLVVIVSLGIRQTFGLFFFDFNADLNISISHFGFVIGLQLLMWGVFSPIFGFITDRYGGATAIFIGFLFYLAGLFLFYSGLNTGYESSPRSPSMVTKVLGAIFNPANFLHNIFGKKPREMRKLRKMKKQDEIRTILASRFDREMLTALLQVDKIDLDLLISECNYSDEFIKTANDLQILDAISECYEEYKILSKGQQTR